MPTPTLAALVESARNGDQGAFAAILDRFAARLMLYVHVEGGRLLGSDYDAEDVFQTVAARAWHLLASFEFRSESALHAWFRAITDHVLGDRVRYLHGKGRDLAVSAGAAGFSSREPLDSATSVGSATARRETVERIRAVLARLDPDAQRLVVAHMIEGRTFAEIGAELGVSRSTVFDRVQRAARELRQMLGDPERT